MSTIDENQVADIRDARSLFPATADSAYFNTAAVGLASKALTAAYHEYVDDWSASGLDYVRGEAAAESARTAVASLIGADRSDIALIASVSAAAGLIAAQFGPAASGHNVVIGEREYSSNHFPWRLLAHKGYEVRQVPFRNGGLEPDDIPATSTVGRNSWRSAAFRQRPDIDLMSRRSQRWPAPWGRSSSSTAHR